MNENRDVYYGDMVPIKKRTLDWGVSHPKYQLSMRIKQGSAVLALLIVIGLYFIDPETASQSGLNYFSGSILAVLIILLFVARASNRKIQSPFKKLYTSRFEASDEGIYCIYHVGLSEYVYYIDDMDIKEWILDDECECMYIKGTASLTKNKRSGSEELGPVEAFYMLYPFDSYELDDLTAPYGDIVRHEDGTLRDRYIAENIITTYIPKKAGAATATKVKKLGA